MTAASADRALMGLAQQVTADVVACSVMLAHVPSYLRREHGKLEEVRGYERLPEETQRWIGPLGPNVEVYGRTPEVAKTLHGLRRISDANQQLLADRGVRVTVTSGESLPEAEVKELIGDLKKQGLISVSGWYNSDTRHLKVAASSKGGTPPMTVPASGVLAHELMHALDDAKDLSSDPEWAKLNDAISQWYENEHTQFFTDSHMDHRIVGAEGASRERVAEVLAQHQRNPELTAPIYLGFPLPTELVMRIHAWAHEHGLDPREEAQ